MAVIIKNTTGSDIFIEGAGENVLASSQIVVDPKNYDSYSGSASPGTVAEDATFIADVNSGDLVVNNGTVDLTAVQGLRYLRELSKLRVLHDSTIIEEGVNSITITGENTSVTKTANGEVEIQIGDTNTEQGLLFSVGFHIDGNNQYAELLDTQEGTNDVPFIFPYGAELRAFTWTNDNSNVNTDIEIRKNGTGSGSNVAVVQVRGRQNAYKNDFSGISFTFGDSLVVYFDNVSGGNNPDKGYLQLFFRITDDTPTEVIS